jgi:hypothetical protein
MNGTINGRTNGMVTYQTPKVQLEINTPFHAKLKFATGLLCKSQFSGSDQMLFTLTDDRKLYVPLSVADKMQHLGGQEFIITKKQALASRKVMWIVNRADAFPPAVRQSVTTPCPVEPAYDDGDYIDHPPPTKEELRAQENSYKGYQPPPSQPAAYAAPAPPPSPARMTAALHAAIDSLAAAATYAKEKYGIAVQFNEEDIRCVASTLYIQNSRSNS